MWLLLQCLQVFIPLVLAQSKAPDPTFDCSNPNFQVIYTACKAGDYTKCCAVGTSCCAGGCCDLLSNCLNVGTSNEICCNANDPTLCGQGGSGTKPPFAVQSVVCTGSTGLSSYYCPPGATCNSAEDSCIGGSPSNGQGSSPKQQSSSSAASPVASASPSSEAQKSASSKPEGASSVETPGGAPAQASTVTIESHPTTTSEAGLTVTATPPSSPTSSSQKGSAAQVDRSAAGIGSLIWAMLQVLFTYAL